MNLILSPKATPEEAKARFTQLIMDIGPGFHPDTDPAGMVNSIEGVPIFNTHQVELLRKSMNILFNIFPDPYEIGLPVALSIIKEMKNSSHKLH
jgi:hypothetical protein